MFYVYFMSMQAVVKNANDEASKQNINLTSASRYSSLLATNGIHELDREAIASEPRTQRTLQAEVEPSVKVPLLVEWLRLVVGSRTKLAQRYCSCAER